MIKNLFRYFYYLIYDLLKIFINLKSTNNFIILYPRIISLILKDVLIFDKIKKNFFFKKLEAIMIYLQCTKYFLKRIII